MKKTIIVSAALMLTLAGCDDFLTLESPDFSTDKFWRDSVDVEAGLSAVYGQLDNRCGTYTLPETKYVVETFREDVMERGDDVYNYPEWGQMFDFTYNNENSKIKEYWMNCYNGINYANNVLFGIEKVQREGTKMTPKTYNTLKGETLFLRAYMHFKALLNWERIVVRNEYLTGEAQTHRELSERVDAWDFICDNLKEAAGMLPEKRVALEAGRATSGAAYSYLGWAYLTRAYEEPARKDEFLQLAMEALNNVKGYQLEANFESMFNGKNSNCKESIFELQFTSSTDNGAWHRHVLHLWIAPPVMRGWDEIRPSAMIIDEFKKEGRIAEDGLLDWRAYGSLIFDDPYYATGGHIFGLNYSELFDAADKIQYCYRKYLPATMKEMTLPNLATNIPLMRYANVMLMKAEILNEQGHPEQAIPLIDEIRRVHGHMPAMQGTSSEDVKAQIEHERLLEFALENYRFYDLRRWGLLDERMQAAGRTMFNSKEHSFLPIPLMEIQTNNKIQ